MNNRILIHIVFWLIMCLMFYVFFSWFIYESTLIYLVNLIAILPPQIILSYFIIYTLIPKYLYQKKYISFAILLILSIYLMTCLSRFLTIYIVEDINARGFEKESIFDILTQLNHLISRYLIVVILAPLIIVPIKLMKDNFKEKQELESLKKEKARAELNFLKAQIHPHFLFNTLNNLYLLAEEKSDQTSEVILKLSEILDYMLYQCNQPTVYIQQEVDLIENYIALESLRYGKRLSIELEKRIYNPNAKIAPLLLISLVENAFKHGVSDDPKNPSINIKIQEKENQLFLNITNTKQSTQQNDSPSYKNGIGLKNFKSQLELQYKGKYTLEVIETKKTYDVHLMLKL